LGCFAPESSLLAFDVNRVAVAGVAELLELERLAAVFASLRGLVVSSAADAAAEGDLDAFGVGQESQPGAEGGQV
jgi:hypothetical protein